MSNEQDAVEQLQEALDDAEIIEIRTRYELELLALVRDAKRALEASQQENERLRDQRDEARYDLQGAAQDAHRLAQENDALKAELSKWKPRYAGFGDNEQEISNED